MNVEAAGDEAVDNVLDLGVGGSFLHHDDHGRFLLSWAFPVMTGNWPALFLVFLRAAGMHGAPLGGASLVNDAFEKTANGGVGQRAGIVPLGVREDFVFAVGLIERNLRHLLQFAD